MLVPLAPADTAGPITTAVVGAGFIGRGLVHRLARRPTMAAPLVLNRRSETAVEALDRAGFQRDHIVVSDQPERLSEALAAGSPAVTQEPDVLPSVEGIDVVVEATGAMTYGTGIMLDALTMGRSVVSLNAEVDALLGHHLDAVAAQHQATYTNSDGDQPGVLLRMLDEAGRMGLEAVVALNCKRNLDVRQNRAASRAYAKRDGTSVAMTTSFGDGTKMHIENVVTSNLSGLRPPPLGTPGVRTELATVAGDVHAAGIPSGSVHFTLGGDFGGGVVVLASSQDPGFDAPYLRYGKLGDGPWYPLFRPYHLIYMETPTTIEQVAAGGPPLGRRTAEPVAVCASLAKQPLAAGTQLDGIGGDSCYGVAVNADEGASLLPIGLAEHATVVHAVAADQPVLLDDVELDDDAPLVQLWRAQGAISAAR